MARVALVKTFTGLNLGVRQLSAELRAAGHETLLIFFKRYVVGPVSLEDRYEVSEHPALTMFAKGETYNWNMYRPVSSRERELLVEELEAFGADLVGFSLPTMCISVASDLSDYIREHVGLPIAWGGPGPTLEPERAIAHADVVCINEGEEVIVELAERVDEGKPLAGIPGTWARNGDGSIFRGEKRPLVHLDRIAIPDAEPDRTIEIDADVVNRKHSPYNVFHHYDIMTQRGCPFSCSFCIESKYQEMFGKKGSLRRRSVDLVIDELKTVKEKFSLNGVMFWDDVFTVDRRWLREFAVKYAREIDLPFWCYTYPTTTRRDDIELLRDAGCVSMTMGIQSGSQRILNDVFNRPTPLHRAVEAAEVVMNAGIMLYFDLITRVPFETEDDLKETFEFLLRLPDGIKMSGVGHMRSYPGYSYTRRLEASEQSFQVDDETYEFYNRLFYVALADIPVSMKRAIATDPHLRRHPELLTPLLPQWMDLSYVVNDDTMPIRQQLKQRRADLGIGQGDLAEEVLQPRPRPTVRRLPLLT